MSTLWTPSGERPIRREPEPAGGPGAPGGPTGPRGPAGAGSGPALTEEEMQAQVAELRDRLAATPAEVVVANHAFGLFELAALHLSLEKPQLEQARLAIDAFAALVEGLGPRLGDHAKELADGLAQLRMAYVQIQGSHTAGAGDSPDSSD